ncbi:glutathione S-transferase family protein [Flavimaricola marinus]|uniref:Disulfide-bond oxidoreductase YfcG n=1 Tax=Flavimaricola marinus TaxID=1819565 RepID=A0A238LAZ5_9RHOB|nr:glutathione S-transferase N-terminal domain-containing protein [Flavimaricola marinus]SMY06771.1 Disulfide-bond oxidoreductase YfcG [Flavimaricola marinus]
MSDLTAFEITKRWPPANSEVIQLYSYPTPNGVKASIVLEELGLDYEPHLVTLSDADVKSDAFLSLNPNNKIPAIIDPDGPDGQPIGLFESGAILIYLAEKAGKLLGDTPEQKYKAIQWVMFQMGGVGPMFGQLGFFVKFAGSEIEDPRPRERYIAEAKRLLAVLDKELEGKDWIVGPFTIADIALAPWLAALDFYGAEDLVGWSDLKNVPAYVERFNARPAAAKGKGIPAPK